ncbi:enhancer of mRNA-decapping protein 4 homolog isoform X4 [Anopheles arabiensis]|uniref:enhancer of mRNA-decapping protein 4 homolog isoform X4 n=1 Tax=Anopheles arabiensis TaxID=7173 RepID=UPI001AADA342|nr:enhancer of mRNA-decapping protein 4 homolog isoform X4 [Anopheles arabiensis]
MLILAIITTVELSRLLQRVYLRRYLADPAHTEQQQQQHQSAPLLNHISSSLLERLEFTMETTDRTVSTVGSGSKKFVFNADNSQHSFKTTDKNITVVCTEGKHDRGSSKIKLVNVVNFKWEQKNYPGRLIACHKDCYLLAYSIRVTKQSKSEGMVRVAHLDLPERGLIKGLSDEILDLQFSHNSTTECLLGIIERTTLHVHQVLVKGEKVTTALKVKIVDPLEGHVPICDRITWCPYLGDGTDFNDEFAKQLLVWTRGSTFQCYSISVLTKSYIDTTDLKASDIEEGGFKANDGEATITGSVFSDDGTTLALSSSDGLIRFYQVYQHANDRSPRRLHLWKPHDGKPITSFFFLDNYTETVNNKTIWKHAITCAENNAEIKVWCCESWECLQTVRLTSPVEASLHFKAEIDISSTYLVLTERSTRQIYVLQVRKGQSAGSSAESEPNKPTLSKGGTRSIVQPYIVSIAEYPLSASVLGFSILYAAAGNSKYGDYDDDEDDEQASPKCVMIRMFLVQPNNLQDCTLMYEAIPDSESEPLTKELTDDPVRDDAEATESTGNSSSVSSSASNETTDNNVSHGPSEEDDRLVDETAAKGKKVDGKNGAQGTLNNGSDNVEEEEEEDDSNNPIALKMAEAAQKLNDVFVSIRTANSSAEGTNVGGTSGPTTPASSSNKVNLMTPDSFSTPGSATRSEKIKSDETVNPDVLSTLFMLAKATKQHQQQQPPASVADMVASAGQQVTQPTTMPTTDALEAFVNMVKNRSEAADDSVAASKAKHRNSTNGPGNNMEEDSVTDAPTVPPMPSAEMLASGGSSPSREVQQIMSTKGPVISMVEDLFLYSCVERKDDYDEEEEEEDDEEEGVLNVADRFDEEDGVVVVVPNGTNDNADEEVVDEKDPEPDVADASVLLSAEKATVAASALKEPAADPTIEREEVSAKRKSSALLHDSPGEESAKVEPNDEPSAPGFWPSSVPTDVPAVGKDVVTTAPPTIVHVPDSSKQIAELSSKLDRMMDLMVAQSRQIEQLNVQLDAMKKARVEEQRKNSATMNRFNQTLPKTIETQLSGLLVQHSLKMEQTLVSCFNNQQARIAETLTHLPQAMIAQLQGRLLQAIVQEMQQKLLPAINGKLDMVQRAVAADLAEKLRTNEGAIRDSIQRTVRSEPVMKAMSTAIQTGMRTVLYDVYHASLREVILPSYSKQCEELFRQMSKAFSYGILELIQKVDKHLEGIGKMQDRTGELVESVRQLPKELSTTADQTTIATVRALRETIEKDMRGLHASLLRSVREHIRQEIEKGFEAQASSLEDSVLSVVRSQAQTPAPSNMDVQDQIKQYLNGGQINKAFHKALLSNDLSLVEFLLERADHKQVFNPCPLEQTVLLSLIQQISADMANHNELKHKYLSDAIVNLDFQDPITKEHSPKVIMELISNCQKFMTANPQNPLCTSLKMLVIAAQYIGFKNT